LFLRVTQSGSEPSTLFGLPVLVDELPLEREDIAFNAGHFRVHHHAGGGLRAPRGGSGVSLRTGTVDRHLVSPS
jgi:hypothetical protein